MKKYHSEKDPLQCELWTDNVMVVEVEPEQETYKNITYGNFTDSNAERSRVAEERRPYGNKE